MPGVAAPCRQWLGSGQEASACGALRLGRAVQVPAYQLRLLARHHHHRPLWKHLQRDWHHAALGAASNAALVHSEQDASLAWQPARRALGAAKLPSAVEPTPAQQNPTAAWRDLQQYISAGGGDLSKVDIQTFSVGRGVAARATLRPGDVALRVPLAAAMVDAWLPAAYPGAAWNVNMAVALLREARRGRSSPHHAYLQLLPEHQPTPLLMSQAELAQMQYLPAVLAAHEYQQMAEAAWAALQDAAKEQGVSTSSNDSSDSGGRFSFYLSAASAPSTPPLDFTFDELRWALTMVQSRSLRMWALGVRVMLPGIDLLNHAAELLPSLTSTAAATVSSFDSSRSSNDSSVASNGNGNGKHVKSVSGNEATATLTAGSGDGSGGNEQVEASGHLALSGGLGREPRDASVTFVVNKDIPAGEQVWWSYGKRGNDDFFLYHGFVIPGLAHEDIQLFEDVPHLVLWYCNALYEHSRTLVSAAPAGPGAPSAAAIRGLGGHLARLQWLFEHVASQALIHAEAGCSKLQAVGAASTIMAALKDQPMGSPQQQGASTLSTSTAVRAIAGAEFIPGVQSGDGALVETVTRAVLRSLGLQRLRRATASLRLHLPSWGGPAEGGAFNSAVGPTGDDGPGATASKPALSEPLTVAANGMIDVRLLAVLRALEVCHSALLPLPAAPAASRNGNGHHSSNGNGNGNGKAYLSNGNGHSSSNGNGYKAHSDSSQPATFGLQQALARRCNEVLDGFPTTADEDEWLLGQLHGLGDHVMVSVGPTRSTARPSSHSSSEPSMAVTVWPAPGDLPLAGAASSPVASSVSASMVQANGEFGAMRAGMLSLVVRYRLAKKRALEALLEQLGDPGVKTQAARRQASNGSDGALARATTPLQAAAAVPNGVAVESPAPRFPARSGRPVRMPAPLAALEERVPSAENTSLLLPWV